MEFPTANISLLLLFGSLSLVCIESGTRFARPAEVSGYRATITPLLYIVATVMIAVSFYCFVLPEFNPYPYADDWVFATPLNFTTGREWIHWLFMQHVDHRIPIQKAITFAVLRLSGFDFRYIVGINYALAIGAATMLMSIARQYRGHRLAGDMIIPLAMLHFSAGYTLWGFQFQFVSSIFFFALFLFLAFRGLLVASAFALMGAAWCGVNGLLFATVGTIGMLVWFVASRSFKALPVFILALAMEVAIWMAWTPTASESGLNPRDIAIYMYALLPSSMGTFAFVHIYWKFAIVAALLIAMAVTILMRGKQITRQDYLLSLGAAGSFIVMAAVAVGRSKIQGYWQPVISMHYGSMSVFMPVLAWIVVSRRYPRVSVGLGILLVGVYLGAYVANANWRNGIIEQKQAPQKEIESAMRSGASPEELADRFLLTFTVDKAHEADVTTGITAIRKTGAALYGASR